MRLIGNAKKQIHFLEEKSCFYLSYVKYILITILEALKGGS
jgi:hypothetical protein